jgi:hypothetical protein
MLQAFRLAYTNLQEIWSLVLPPHSLLGLKRLAATDGAAFRMSDSLWARIVYDFLLAHRLRTINRGHLLGGLSRFTSRGSQATSTSPPATPTLKPISRPSPLPSNQKNPTWSRAGDGPTGSIHE